MVGTQPAESKMAAKLAAEISVKVAAKMAAKCRQKQEIRYTNTAVKISKEERKNEHTQLQRKSGGKNGGIMPAKTKNKVHQHSSKNQ